MGESRSVNKGILETGIVGHESLSIIFCFTQILLSALDANLMGENRSQVTFLPSKIFAITNIFLVKKGDGENRSRVTKSTRLC